MLSRRQVLAGLAATATCLTALRAGAADTLPSVVVSKDPSCGCCGGWVEHMRAAGFPVVVNEVDDIGAVKARLGVPDDLGSCHTAEVAGYVVEGHVPAGAVKRLLAEKPAGKGLAVPGMPMGSPGMEVKSGRSEAYDVVLFGPAGQSVFARYRGAQAA